MEKKLGQEPAFMQSQIIDKDNKLNSDQMYDERMGMSKRFYAACSAMQGLLANSEISIALSKAYPKADEYDNINKQLTKLSYMHADELLKQEDM